MKADRERQISQDNASIWNLKKGYKSTYFQNRNRVTDVENKHGYQGVKGEV